MLTLSILIETIIWKPFASLENMLRTSLCTKCHQVIIKHARPRSAKSLATLSHSQKVWVNLKFNLPTELIKLRLYLVLTIEVD